MFTVKLHIAIVSFLFCLTASAQTKPDSLGLPGDNFDLYGALELFKKADTPENFEKAINSNDNEVNNLDLDGDGKVDYVKVIDKKDGEAHTLVLQVAVSANETQDVAVIELDKTGNDKAHVQIVGDEELYGKNYIVEPKDETASVDNTNSNQVQKQNLSNNNSNNNGVNNSNQTVVVNVWAWPSVQYIYGPSYAVWSSPWYWNNYPMWWQPWGPVYWRYHYRRSYHYHYPYYHRVSYYRSPRVHDWYYGRRMSAPMVQKNNQSGFYHQRQETYKSNVQPGRKYNSQPAKMNMDGTMQQQELKQQNGIRQQNNGPVKEQTKTPVKQQPIDQQPVKQQQQKPIRQEQPVQQQPVKQQQEPVKQQPMQQQPVKQQQTQPIRQQQQQPVKQQQAQPQKQAQPRMQSAPQQRSMQPSGQGGRGRGR